MHFPRVDVLFDIAQAPAPRCAIGSGGCSRQKSDGGKKAMPAEGANCPFLRAGLSAHPASLAASARHIYHFAVIEKRLPFRMRCNAVPCAFTFLRISCLPPNPHETAGFSDRILLKIKDLRASSVSTGNEIAGDGASQRRRHAFVVESSVRTRRILRTAVGRRASCRQRLRVRPTRVEFRGNAGGDLRICGSPSRARAPLFQAPTDTR
jgi:hypothetical protein